MTYDLIADVNQQIGAFRAATFRWFICGGWAIDLFLGRKTREHHDLDIGIFREDQVTLRNSLRGWRLQKAVEGRILEWQDEEFLQLPIHEIHAEREDGFRLEVLLNEKDGDDWVYRRDARARLPMTRAVIKQKGEIPFLAPEIVLLFKSKTPRSVDFEDLRATLEMMPYDSRQWLARAIETTDGDRDFLKLSSFSQ